MKRKIFTIVFLFIIAVFSLCKANAGQKVREYRPLEATKMAIAPGATAIAVTQRGTEVEGMFSQAWKKFDNRQWNDAREAFLAVLGEDPQSRLAAEGLAMSVYRSGDYKGAFELAREMQSIMPSVQELVSETVVADVQYMISKGEFTLASKFLGNFPSVDSEYGRAHELLGGAYAISRALKADGDTTADPEEPSSPDLAKN